MVKISQTKFFERGFMIAEDTKFLSLTANVYRDSVLKSTLRPEERIIDNLEDLKTMAELLRSFGAKVVLTMGTFDLVHIGHARYITEAGKRGGILIVGVEDDEKARNRKGENRPVVPYVERAEMITFIRSADIVAKKSKSDPKWGMIKSVRPDVLIAVKGTYEDSEIESLKEFCGEIIVLPRQAETSTSAKIRKLVLDGADIFTKLLVQKLPDLIKNVYEEMKNGDER